MFGKAWASHYSFMRFRSTSSHAQCSECMKHKTLIGGLGHHLNARKMQTVMFHNHLRAQFADRCQYWYCRGLSRNRGLDICMMVDGMDQQKCALPRHPIMRSKAMDGFQRPRMHCYGCLCHGHHLGLYISEPDLPKDSNTTIEVIMDALHQLKLKGVPLHQCNITVQGDNTCRELKNGIAMRWASSLVSDSVVQSLSLSFLRSGHSHEDLDQAFGQTADWIRRRIPVAQTSDDLVSSLTDFCKVGLVRTHEPLKYVTKLDSTRNWLLGLS